MKNLFLKITILILLSVSNSFSTDKIILASNFPVAEIVESLLGAKADVHNVLSSGSQPFNFVPSSDDMYKLNVGEVFFYSSESIEPWVLNYPAKYKIKLIDFVDNKDKIILSIRTNANGIDDTIYAEHFWTDPLIVKSILPKIVDTLSKIYPDLEISLKSNLSTFEKRLDLLNLQVIKMLKNTKNLPIYFQTSAWRYFSRRFNLIYSGELSFNCGEKPDSSTIQDFIKDLNRTGAKLIFASNTCKSEIVKEISIRSRSNVYYLDVFYTDQKKKKYSDLILDNAKEFRKALQ